MFLLTCISSSLNAYLGFLSKSNIASGISSWFIMCFVCHIVWEENGESWAEVVDMTLRTWGKRAEVQDNAALQIRMIATVTRYFYTQTCSKMVLISCPRSCQRMLFTSSQTLLEADSQNPFQKIHRLPSNRQSGGAYNGNCCSKCRGNGKHMFQWERQSNKEVGGWGIAATAAARAEPRAQPRSEFGGRALI